MGMSSVRLHSCTLAAVPYVVVVPYHLGYGGSGKETSVTSSSKEKNPLRSSTTSRKSLRYEVHLSPTVWPFFVNMY
jgi:hypothetical protein